MAESPTSELSVSGMTCNNCARRVTDALQTVTGVHSVSVNVETGRASVRWSDNGAANTNSLVSALKAAGYPAKPISAQSHHAHHKSNWHANLWLGGIVTALLMIGEWVFDFGMRPWFQWASFALAGAVQVFAGAQFYRGAWQQLKVGSSNMDTLVALGSTTAFGYSTWALFAGIGGHVYFMEAAAIITLISIGHWIEARVSSKASHALKSLLQLAPQTARRIQSPESKVQGSSSRPFDVRTVSFSQSAIRNPQSAIEEEVPVSELQIGDFVALRPGDRVPVDGVVTEGNSAVDESMLTGESVPVDKAASSELYAGTVNANGRLVMRVTATGESTALAHIIAAVQRAQTSRADIQRLGDRVSSVFVPIVVAIALAAGLWWGLAPESANYLHEQLAKWLWPAHTPAGLAAGFIIAAAVLIIACPCAMGLATPAAIMASANAAARRGILIRDGVALEKAGQVTAVVFDKTGTLTVGKPEVVAIGAPVSDPARNGWTAVAAGNASQLKLELQRADQEIGAPVSLAAALAAHSTHPVSRALAALAGNSLAVADWREVRGAGVEGNIQHSTSNAQQPNAKARLGSLAWLRETGVNLSGADAFINEWSSQGATIVGLAVENSLNALFAVRDTVKPGAADVVQQLGGNQLSVHLLTGDNKLTATNIAKQVGIAVENVFAEVRPEQKAEFVKSLQARGERVAFVGDGINDAPALEQADLGIAVGKASDVAREAADVILLKSEISAVPEALGLARATLRTIKQNLFWAFFYNAAGIPLAALGFMSPVLCAAAMGLSDLVVIGNALRLMRWRR